MRAGVAFVVLAVAALALPWLVTPASAANPAGDLDQCANGGSGDPAVACTGSGRQYGNLNGAELSTSVAITDVAPAITVTKTPSRTSVPEPGGDVTFTVEVANRSSEPVTLFELEDGTYGYIADPANGSLVSTTCTLPRTIGIGGSTTCSFTATVHGNAGAVRTAAVVAKARDNELNVAQASGSATVSVTDVQPVVAIDKTASAGSVAVGTAVTYAYSVTTPGPESLLSVVVTDDRCSPVAPAGGDADADGQLDPGEAWRYTCTAALAQTTTNVGAVQAADDEGNVARASDTATVTVAASAVAIDKQANPESTTPGGTVVYTYDVTNPGGGPLHAVAVTDDKCSPVHLTGGDADADELLDPGETWRYACTFTTDATVSSLTNIGTVTATDAVGATVSASDTATIAIVAGSVIERPAVLGVELPRTGGAVRWWLATAGLLLALGAGLLLAGRRPSRSA